ncbi:MAG: DMT family transporter [Planctomycetota bacterium]
MTTMLDDLGGFTGELAALGAAAVWAVATVMYRRLGTAIPPLTLNLCKGVIASPLLAAVVLLSPSAASSEGGGLGQWSAIGLLAISGAIGIGVGDTAFFAALNRLRERRTILVCETAAPPLAALLGVLWLGELLSPWVVLGAAVTLAGVGWVVIERSPEVAIPRDVMLPGAAWAVVAAACQAVGAVLSRQALTESDIGPVASALIRIVAGVAVLLIWMPLSRTPYLPPALRNRKAIRAVVIATVLGTFLGLSLMQVSLKFTSAAVTQTLLATSTLLVLPLLAAMGERITPRAIFGAVLAIAGVAVMMLAGAG